MKFALAAIIFCFGLCSLRQLHAQTGAGGFVIGKDHAYFLEAPTGWVMDSEDAAKQSVGAIFHPVNIHWPASNVIIYTDLIKKRKDIQVPADAMRADVARFKEDGSVVQPVQKPSVKTKSGGLIADVYYFGPDKRGQFDARAYFSYKGYIDYFVLTARDETTFKKSLPAFEHVVESYKPQLEVSREKKASPQ